MVRWLQQCWSGAVMVAGYCLVGYLRISDHVFLFLLLCVCTFRSNLLHGVHKIKAVSSVKARPLNLKAEDLKF